MECNPTYVALEKDLKQRRADLETFKSKIADDDSVPTP